ncbi:MAG: orotate phosphoribosyltransferase [Halioglobus sp.]|nr:orotate phosphoribosyltransferase [Halioglobus sp.]
MRVYQKNFIELAQKCEALTFGEYTLKSGRTSPYFFNAGAFSRGAALSTLGRCYAQSIVDSGLEFDVLVGPAYKGIALAAVTAVALADGHGADVQFAYNRKEVKLHGEGGRFVGAPVQGRVLVIDDVITAGTAVGEIIAMLLAAGAELVGVVIGLDRKERGSGTLSAVEAVQKAHGVPVISIITIDHIIDYLEAAEVNQTLSAMREYREHYGV